MSRSSREYCMAISSNSSNDNEVDPQLTLNFTLPDYSWEYILVPQALVVLFGTSSSQIQTLMLMFVGEIPSKCCDVTIFRPTLRSPFALTVRQNMEPNLMVYMYPMIIFS